MADLWQLKLKRAQYHVVEIKSEVRRYAESHPYEVVRIPQSKRNQHRWRYALHMTSQPDPMLTVIFGEFIHDLRTALDNIVAASVPRKYKYTAGFPISTKDVMELDEFGKFVFRANEAGKRFTDSLKGLPDDAIAFIEKVQPYRPGNDPDTHSLALLARLDNASKHRDGIMLGSGLKNATLDLTTRGKTERHPLTSGRNQITQDGAEVFRFEDRTLTESEVDVKVRGTAGVTMEIRGLGGNKPMSAFRLQSALWQPLTDTRWILGRFERFVLRGV
jgi:hypothetical protein